MSIFKWLSGGRPMQKVEFHFTDKVSGQPVYIFRDAFGRGWMATHAWARFRVRLSRFDLTF